MDVKFEFSESEDAVFSGYVFTRGYVDFSTKLSLPLGSTLDRYEGLILLIGGNGRTKVRVPLSSFQPVNPADPPLDPFLIHTFTIRFEPRRHCSGSGLWRIYCGLSVGQQVPRLLIFITH
nr:hypothetical protein [Tanacetum cinerariifolium]